MRIRLFSLVIMLSILCGCSYNPYLYQNYCQKDYWGDSQYEIFGRKNCVGETGHWNDENQAHDGYYCTNPNCRTQERVRCKDTCGCY